MDGGAAVFGAGVGGRRAGAARRVVTVDGVVGVLVRSGGRWVLGNDGEVRMVEALRGSGGARGRLLALAATLDAGVVDGSDLRRLNRLLGQIDAGVPCLVGVPEELLGAVACACAHWESLAAGRWLGWALSARLEGNLVRRWLPGPGLESMLWKNRLFERGFGRETHWISEMPPAFWKQLVSHRWRPLIDIAVASSPGTSARVLKDLAVGDSWRHELLDAVASHPRTPRRPLEQIALGRLSSVHVQARVAQSLSAGPRGAGPPRWEL